MGGLSRMKGANFERKIAKWLNSQELESAVFVRELRETQQGNIGDVPDQENMVPFIHQVKHMKTPSPFRALKEAKEAAVKRHGEEMFGVALIRRDGGEDMVCITPALYGAFLQLLESETIRANANNDLEPGDMEARVRYHRHTGGW